MVRWFIFALVATALAACQGPPTSKPPAWCQARGALTTTCGAAHCVAAVVIDYKRVEPRGYRVFALEGQEVDDDEALDLAIAHITKVRGAPPPDTKEAKSSGDFFNVFLAYQNGNEWLVVIHRYTGQVLFAEPQLWGDPKLRGFDFPLPDKFADAEALGCVQPSNEAHRVTMVGTGQPTSGVVSTPTQAWKIVERLNITQEFTSGFKYRAMVISYAPATGEFDAESADWYAFIHRVSN